VKKVGSSNLGLQKTTTTEALAVVNTATSASVKRFQSDTQAEEYTQAGF
jgi:hypothetical protein